jgi:hypothetical protein
MHNVELVFWLSPFEMIWNTSDFYHSFIYLQNGWSFQAASPQKTHNNSTSFIFNILHIYIGRTGNRANGPGTDVDH